MAAVSSPYSRVFLGEAVFKTAKDPKYLLGSDGYRTCVGFAGWDPQTTTGFLAHFVMPSQASDFFERGLEILAKLTQGSSCKFKCILRGGCSKAGASLQIIEIVKKALTAHSKVHFEIVEEDPPTEKFVLKSLSLNTKTGAFGNYDVKEDPNPRELTESEENRMFDLQAFKKLTLLL